MTVISNAERDTEPRSRNANRVIPTLLSIVLEEEIMGALNQNRKDQLKQKDRALADSGGVCSSALHGGFVGVSAMQLGTFRPLLPRSARHW